MFTIRERTVGRCVRKGLSNKQIAEALGISVRGVKFHVSNLLHKSGLGGRIALVEFLQNDPAWLAAGGDERPVQARLKTLQRQSRALEKQKRLVDAMAATCEAFLDCEGAGGTR